MTNRHLRLLKNACANLVRGGAGSLIGVVLPPLLIHLMPADRYSAWMLVLQLSAVCAFLDFGLQTLVGRFVAHAEAKGERCDDLVSTSVAILAGAAVLGLAITAGLAAGLPLLFRHMPAALVPQARIALLLVGGSAALGLPATVGIGIFAGKQRSGIPAAVITVGRFLGAALVVIAARHGAGLVPLAALLALANLLSSAALCAAVRRWAGPFRFSLRLCTGAAARQILAGCFSLSVWSVAMLLVGGLDTMLVGHFDFRAVAPYTIAAAFVALLTGLQNSLFTALIPHVAARSADASSSRQPLGPLLLSSTRYGLFLLLALGLPLLIGARWLLALWAGAGYAVSAPLLQILVLASIVRLAATPYATFLIGTGQQKLVTVTPLVEGVSNLLISLAAGRLLGAAGVALGTLAGAVIGLACHVFINLPRTSAMGVRPAEFCRDGLARPLLCALPALPLLCLALPTAGTNAGLLLGAAALTLPALGLTVWKWGLTPTERRTVSDWVPGRKARVAPLGLPGYEG